MTEKKTAGQLAGLGMYYYDRGHMDLASDYFARASLEADRERRRFRGISGKPAEAPSVWTIVEEMAEFDFAHPNDMYRLTEVFFTDWIPQLKAALVQIEKR